MEQPKNPALKSVFRNVSNAKINESYRPSTDENNIRQLVYKRFHEMKEHRLQYDQHWDKWERQWEGWRPQKGSDDWESTLVAPLSTSIVETIMAEIQQYDVEPPLKHRGYEDEYRVAILKEAIKFSKNSGDFKLEEADIKKEAFIFGSGFGEELFWNDKRDVSYSIEKVDADGNKTFEMKEASVFSYQGLYLEHVPIRELWFDEAAKTINRGRRQANDCVRQLIMPLEQAKDFLSDPMFNLYEKNKKHLRAGGDTETFQFYQPPGRIDKDTEVQILFYWAKRPDLLVVVANDVVFHMGPNPYHHKMLPFVQAYDIKRTNSLYHKGEMELIESLQEELTNLKRMRMDRLHLTIDPMWLVSKRDNLSEDDVLARPHGIIEVEDPTTAAREMRPSDTPQSAYREEDYLNRDAQRLTGIDDGSMGIDRTSLTATEFTGLRESTLKKIALKLWYIHNGFHVEHTRLRSSNILQFWTQPQYEKVLGEIKNAKYQQMIQDRIKKGEIVDVDGQLMTKSFPKIRLEDKQLVRKRGKVSLIETKGTHFFEIQPEDILPYHMGYDIVFEGTPSLPLTKSLLQTKATELFDRLMPFAMQGVGDLDPGKIIEDYITNWDIDPAKFRAVQQDPDDGASDDQLRLAMEENNMMMKGHALAPTPYAVPSHSQIHTAFMMSKEFQGLDQNDPEQQAIVDAFTEHVMGELMAQQHRGGQGQLPSGGQQMQGVDGNMQPSIQSTPGAMPGMVSGSAPNPANMMN